MVQQTVKSICPNIRGIFELEHLKVYINWPIELLVLHLHGFTEYGRECGRALIAWCLIPTFPLLLAKF